MRQLAVVNEFATGAAAGSRHGVSAPQATVLDRRTSRRFALWGRAELRNCLGSGPILLKDIALGGIGFSLPSALAGEIYHLTLASEAGRCLITCETVATTPAPGGMDVGAAFRDLSPRQQEVVAVLVSSASRSRIQGLGAIGSLPEARSPRSWSTSLRP